MSRVTARFSTRPSTKFWKSKKQKSNDEHSERQRPETERGRLSSQWSVAGSQHAGRRTFNHGQSPLYHDRRLPRGGQDNHRGAAGAASDRSRSEGRSDHERPGQRTG